MKSVLSFPSQSQLLVVITFRYEFLSSAERAQEKEHRQPQSSVKQMLTESGRQGSRSPRALQELRQ